MLVVVSGPPASGKTSLARALAHELDLPWISKDALKETLYDLFGSGEELEQRLEEAARRLLLTVAEQQLASDLSAIVESNFDRDAELEPKLDRAAARLLLTIAAATARLRPVGDRREQLRPRCGLRAPEGALARAPDARLPDPLQRRAGRAPRALRRPGRVARATSRPRRPAGEGGRGAGRPQARAVGRARPARRGRRGRPRRAAGRRRAGGADPLGRIRERAPVGALSRSFVWRLPSRCCRTRRCAPARSRARAGARSRSRSCRRTRRCP